jgi:hypothetical protein
MSPARPRSDFFGKNKRSGRPTVDEDALITRYVRDHWTLGRCAESFGTTEGHVKSILVEHDVEINVFPKTAILDEQRVLRMYGPLSIQSIALTLGTNPGRIVEILERHDVKIGEGSKPHLMWNDLDDPSPSDLLHPTQAAQILGKSKDFLWWASVRGQIRAARKAEDGMRWYRRSDVEKFRDRLTQNEGEEYRC